MSAIQIDLPKTMRSVMCYGPRDYRFEERSEEHTSELQSLS